MRKYTAIRFKMGAFIRRCWWYAAVTIFLVGCADQTSSQTTDKTVVMDTAAAEVVAIDSPKTTPADLNLDPSLPPQKPEAELAALRKYWEDALAAERKILVSTRLEEWLAALEDSTDEEGDPVPRFLKPEHFKSLTTKERIGYQMFHPEEYLQNCAEYAAAAGLIEAICRKLPWDESGNYWSERQMAAIVKDSNEVKKAVVAVLQSHQAASIPMLRLIAEMKIKEAIPHLIAIYQSQTVKDDLILTTLMEIMERSNYWKWIYSPTCKALVVSDHEILPLQQANIDSVLTFAKRFADR